MTQEQTILGRCMTIARTEGLAELARRGTLRVWERVWQSNSADWYRVTLPPKLAHLELPPGVAVHFDRREETLEWMRQIQPVFGFAYVPQEAETARELCHPLGLATVDGKYAGYVKLAIKQAFVTDLNRRITLPERTAFIYDTFVHPDFRRRGLASLLVAGAMAELPAGGYRWLWCHIPRWNVASRNTFGKQGFKAMGFIRNFCVLGLRFATGRPETLLAEDRD